MDDPRLRVRLAALPATLYALPASHPCAAVEAALGLKGLAYERVDMIPVVARGLQWRRFGGITVPGLVFDDGARVLGSRPIMRALDSRVPQPPHVPGGRRSDGDRRRAAGRRAGCARP